jgi:hypothetical protein
VARVQQQHPDHRDDASRLTAGPPGMTIPRANRRRTPGAVRAEIHRSSERAAEPHHQYRAVPRSRQSTRRPTGRHAVVPCTTRYVTGCAQRGLSLGLLTTRITVPSNR